MLVVSEMKNPSHHLYCPFSLQDEFGRGLGRWTFHQATQVVGSKAVRGAEAGLGQVTLLTSSYLMIPLMIAFIPLFVTKPYFFIT